MARATSNDGGLDQMQLAATAYGAFRQAIDRQPSGAEMPTWDELGEEVQAAWIHAGIFAVNCLEDHEIITWPEVARALYDYWAHQVAHIQHAEYDELPPLQQMGWQACSRHIGNMISLEFPADEDIEGHELFWHNWAKQRLAQLALAATPSEIQA